jgi:hypothetical protein
MNANAMHNFLNHFLETNGEDHDGIRCAPAQLVFHPGAAATAGLLRRHTDLPEVFVISMPAQDKKTGKDILVDTFFTADAVQRVVVSVEKNVSSIITPGS